MSKEKIVFNTAERLGIHDHAVLQKAGECLRALHSKGSIKCVNDVAKTVLCLDLSSHYMGCIIDKDTAIKLSGLKKSSYVTNLRNIEKILELDKAVTIPNLCVQLNCTNVKDLAQEILSKYLSNMDNTEIHPQYIAASVYVACKSMGVKVDQSELVQTSRIKPTQWKSLILQFKSVASSLKKHEKQLNCENDPVESTLTVNDANDDIVRSANESEEGYEEWKERILKEAYTALNNKIS